MYQKLITTTHKAICHLFIHCCFKDDAFVEAEVDEAAEKFVLLNMHKDLNFKEEVKKTTSLIRETYLMRKNIYNTWSN